MEPGDGLERGSGTGVSLGDSISRGAIAIGVSGDVGGDSVGSVQEGGVSGPLAETLGGPGHEGGGGTGVAGDTVSVSSVAIGGVSVSVSSVEKGGVSLGVSGPLAVQVQVSGGDRGGHRAIGSVGKAVSVSSITIGGGVGSVEKSSISLGLGLSGPLAVVGSAPVAGGLAVGGGHAGPVGVGVQEGGSVAVDSSVGLSRDSDSGASNNLREREVSEVTSEARDHVPTTWTSF